TIAYWRKCSIPACPALRSNPTFRSVDSCAGIRTRSDQFVTSGLSLLSRLYRRVRSIRRLFIRLAPSVAPGGAALIHRGSPERPSALARRKHHHRGCHDLELAFVPEFLQDVVEHFHPGGHGGLADRLASGGHKNFLRNRGASRPV